MPDIVLVVFASGMQMGQQAYERQLALHLPRVATGLSVRSVRVRSLRSGLPGEARLPLRAASRLPLPAQNALARIAYGGSDLIHRADLRLPAARNEVVTVHDLGPLRFDDEGEIPHGAAKTLQHAKAVVCPSRFAADELAELLGVEGAIVIHNGIDSEACAEISESAELLAPLALREQFVLHSGGATTRKNLVGLAEAWKLVSADVPEVELLMCGPPDPRRAAIFDGLPRVRMLGYVPRRKHFALMSAATAVVVPSVYEGFGLPALEAMTRGTAVVAVNRASLPEICGAAALIVEPQGEALADAITQLLTNAVLRSDLVALGLEHVRGFSWVNSARQHLEVYSRMIG